MEHYDVKKIANAIIYFIDNNVCNLGVTKLMKLCFYADKYHLEAYGTSIFNHTYTKMDHGPVPTWLYGIIRTSISGVIDYDFEKEVKIFNDFISLSQVDSGTYNQVIFSKKQDFNNKFFSKSQIKVLDQVIQDFKNITAKEISELSHQTNAWKNVEINEQISYESMVDNEERSNYIAFLQTEKTSFSSSYRMHKLNKVG